MASRSTRSLERAIAKNPQAASLLEAEAVESPDSRTVVVRTKSPHPALYAALSHPALVIYDAALIEADPARFMAAPNLTGPLRVVAFQKDSLMRLERNMTYWGGPAQVAEIEVRYIPDGATRVNALLSRQVDMAFQLPPESVATLGREHGLTVQSFSSGRQSFILLNTRAPQFADKRVRQAMSLAVDRRALAERVLHGSAEPAKATYSSIFPFALREGYGYDVRRAGELLDAAGWRAGADGVRAKDGQRLAFTLTTYPGRPELGQLAVALQAQLKGLGMAVDIRQVDQITDALRNPFDAALYSNLTAPTGDPGYFLNLFYRTNGPLNFGGFSSPKVDALIAQLNTTADPARRVELAQAAQRELLEEAPHVYLVEVQVIVGLGDRVRGYEPPPIDYYYLDQRIRTQD